MKNLWIVQLLLLGLLVNWACSPSLSEEEQLAHDFYDALNRSDFAAITQMQYDSVRVKEGSYNSRYSLQEYVNWLQWDSVFHPTYKILDLKTDADGVEMTVSKVDERIQFLNGGPMVSKERLRFKEGKIYELEILELVAFDNKGWETKREQLVGWVDQNHPELSGFIFDQSLQGGLNYKKALALFQNRTENDSVYAQEKKAILATLNNETKAAFQRDYEAWQQYWVHDPDITKIYIDFPENSFSESLGWKKIDDFVTDFFKKHPDPEPVPELLDSISVRLYGNGAWVTYEQQDSLRGRKRETRLMEKVNGQWKIAGMQTTIYGFDD